MLQGNRSVTVSGPFLATGIHYFVQSFSGGLPSPVALVVVLMKPTKTPSVFTVASTGFQTRTFLKYILLFETNLCTCPV